MADEGVKRIRDKEKQRKYDAERYLLKKDILNAKRRQYYWDNIEKQKEYSKLYEIENKNKRKEYALSLQGKESLKRRMEKYKKNHALKLLEKSRAYEKTHKHIRKAYHKIFIKTEKGKLKRKRTTERRQMEMGYNPLNTRFEGCNGHHIDNTNVIFIPSDIHRQIPHNHKKQDTMKNINFFAWDYMEMSVL